ncbi:MAG: histidine kinase [Syntrophales bacterium]|nr:histidine kinase [Syntrophales bacterium]MDD5640382.1 histidine kinase [Syntrophales bacterium]
MGYLYHEYHVAFLLKAKEKELSGLADQKAKQLTTWRRERLNDGLLISDDPDLAREIQAWLEGKGPPGAEERISRQLAAPMSRGSYVAAALLDPRGIERLAIAEIRPELLPLVKRIAGEALRTQRIILSDLYRLPQSGAINMTLAVPIRLHQNDKSRIVGVVVYQIDPNYFLYPLLTTWPTLSKTAEMVLVRREIKEKAILFLNSPRLRPGSALLLREPLAATQLPSVRAALGEEGMVQGIDYRGVPVLAANRLIPDSPWFLTVKMDLSEVTAPLRRWDYLIPILTLTFIITAGLGVGFIWRNRDAHFYRQQYQSESERRALLQRNEYLTKYANDIILAVDQDWQIVEANDRAVESYEYTREELFNLHLGDLFVDQGFSLAGHKKKLEEEGKDGLRFEINNRRKDGTAFLAEISASLMDLGGTRLYQYIIRDISDRKLREQALQESEQQLRFLSSQLLVIQESERARISKELHDELGQTLMILKYQLNSLEDRLPKNKKVLRHDCRELLHYLDNIIEDVRRLSWDLRPSVLEKFGLATALKNLLKDFGKHHEIQWDPAQVEGIDHLFPPLSQINIYRIFQEALTNIGRHAQATNISIKIDKHDREAICAIEDNGRGFDPQAARQRESGQRGIGLATMHERARMAGGRLKIWSRPGAGTRLTFTIPREKGE